MLTTSLVQHFSTATFIQEQRYYDCKPLHLMMEGSTSEKTILDRRRMEIGFSAREDSGNLNSGSCYLLSLKQEVSSTSKRAALLATPDKTYEANLDESSNSSEMPTSLIDFPIEDKIVKSTRLYKRKEVVRRKCLRLTAPKTVEVVYRPLRLYKRKGMSTERTEKEILNPGDEYELVVDVQRLARLEKVESKFHTKFGRKPRLVEWAKAVGLSSHALNLQLYRGYRSKEKLIHTNYGLVIYIAQQHKFRGLNMGDLVQGGFIGLMEAIERFDPKFGCRLITYAYWWIECSIRKTIARYSTIIRLPESIHAIRNRAAILKKVTTIEGVHRPTNKYIATRLGIRVETLKRVYRLTTKPIFMSWQKLEYVEDPESEELITTVEKMFMRQHLHRMLTLLTPEEKGIVQLRYGFKGDGFPKLADIGSILGLSRQRIHQIESRALKKMRQSAEPEDLESYKVLII